MPSNFLAHCSMMAIAVVGTALAPTAAVAQTALPGNDATPTQAVPPESAATQDGPQALQEIVVTAQKRVQNLNDVGLTVQAISGDTFAQRNLTSLADIANLVPGLSFSNNLTGAPVYTLRGVGFFETSLAAYPTTSVYVDEVPLPFPVLTSHASLDLQRLEVLKGPQGTLFGQNSTGGAMNFIANKPTRTFSAGINGSYGRFDEVIAEGFVSGPITDTLSARLAFRSENASGWQRSLTRDDTNGDVNNQIARLIVDYDPSGPLSLELTLNGWTDKSDPIVPQLVAKNTQTGGNVGVSAIDNAPFATRNARQADWTPGLPMADNRFLQSALRSTLDLGEVTATSLTSYVDYKQNRRDESDGTPGSNIDQTENRGRIKSFGQELRLADDGRGRVRWVAGLNYSQDIVNQAIRRDFSDSSANAGLRALGYNIVGNRFTSDQRMTNKAVFGNVEYDILRKVTVKGGARYTNAKRSATICTRDPVGAPDGFGAFTYNVFLGRAFGPYQLGECLQINATPAGQTPRVIGGIPVGAPGLFKDSLNQDNVSWTAGIDYHASSNLLLYFNASKGYKAGSFPTAAATNAYQYLPVVQESVQALEGGIKLTALQSRLQFNAAAFHYDYTNKQLRAKFFDPFFGILDNLQNVPKSEISGAEFDLTALLAEGLTANLSYTFLHTRVNRFVSTDLTGQPASFAGSEISYSPKHQAVFNIDYSRAVSPTLKLYAGTTANYRSRAFAALNGDANPPGAISPVDTIFKIKSYLQIDARIGLEGPNDAWRVGLFGKNITNTYYWNNVEAGFDTIGRYPSKPATYGVSFQYRY